MAMTLLLLQLPPLWMTKMAMAMMQSGGGGGALLASCCCGGGVLKRILIPDAVQNLRPLALLLHILLGGEGRLVANQMTDLATSRYTPMKDLLWLLVMVVVVDVDGLLLNVPLRDFLSICCHW